MEQYKINKGHFFICKVLETAYIDGLAKKVNNTYVVEADTWGEAEQRLQKHIANMSVDGIMDCDITDITLAKFNEIYSVEGTVEEQWFNARLDFITIDERTQKEKRTAQFYLYNAKSFDEASRMVNEVMSQLLVDYDKAEIKAAKITDVIYNE